MEFKDRLKRIRKEKRVTQRQVADAIFVSRSTVAKWENGLGIPSKDSYLALLSFFEINSLDLPLGEGRESEICIKKQRVRFTLSLLLWTLFFLFTVYVIWLLYALDHGYGFTPDMAAGSIWEDNERIERPEYVFYYTTTVGEIRVIDTFAVVEKRPIGYQRLTQRISTDAKRVFDANGELYGYLLTYRGKERYYHLFRTTMTMHPDSPGVFVNLLPEVMIKEDVYEVFCHSFFETPFPVTEFICGGNRFYVE